MSNWKLNEGTHCETDHVHVLEKVEYDGDTELALVQNCTEEGYPDDVSSYGLGQVVKQSLGGKNNSGYGFFFGSNDKPEIARILRELADKIDPK